MEAIGAEKMGGITIERKLIETADPSLSSPGESERGEMSERRSSSTLILKFERHLKDEICRLFLSTHPLSALWRALER